MAELDVFGYEVVFGFDGFEVGPGFRGVAVVVGPELDFPGELVVDGWDVACTAYIILGSKVSNTWR